MCVGRADEVIRIVAEHKLLQRHDRRKDQCGHQYGKTNPEGLAAHAPRNGNSTSHSFTLLTRFPEWAAAPHDCRRSNNWNTGSSGVRVPRAPRDVRGLCVEVEDREL